MVGSVTRLGGRDGRVASCDDMHRAVGNRGHIRIGTGVAHRQTRARCCGKSKVSVTICRIRQTVEANGLIELVDGYFNNIGICTVFSSRIFGSNPVVISHARLKAGDGKAGHIAYVFVFITRHEAVKAAAG